jgi:hypothetical protein
METYHSWVDATTETVQRPDVFFVDVQFNSQSRYRIVFVGYIFNEFLLLFGEDVVVLRMVGRQFFFLLVLILGPLLHFGHVFVEVDLEIDPIVFLLVAEAV